MNILFTGYLPSKQCTKRILYLKLLMQLSISAKVMTMGEKQILARVIRIQKDNCGYNHAFLR